MTDREARARAVKILAKSLARDLAAQGFDHRDVLALATELIGEITRTLQRREDPRRRRA
jgi:hypothetical protein